MNKHNREEHEKSGRSKARCRDSHKKMSHGGVATKYPHSQLVGEKKASCSEYDKSFPELHKALSGHEPITHMNTVRGHNTEMESAVMGKGAKKMKMAAGGVGKLRHDQYFQ